MITDYANQDLTLKTPGTPDQYNQATYTSSTIKGRKENTIRLVRDSQGEEVVSSATIYTASTVSVGDLIDDRQVILSNLMADLDGDNQFYEVMVR